MNKVKLNPSALSVCTPRDIEVLSKLFPNLFEKETLEKN